MKKLVFFAFFGLFLGACQQNSPEALKQKLSELDKALGGASVTDNAKALEFISTSEALAATVEKTDPNQYVSLILRAAGLAKTIKQPQKAIELYRKIADGMPQHKKAPAALFMIGFVQENDLSDLEKAEKTYQLFLQRYPNDPDFADDAQNAIKMLGMSPEEIVKKFEQQAAEKTEQ